MYILCSFQDQSDLCTGKNELPERNKMSEQHANHSSKKILDLVADIAELKAEVERLKWANNVNSDEAKQEVAYLKSEILSRDLLIGELKEALQPLALIWVKSESNMTGADSFTIQAYFPIQDIWQARAVFQKLPSPTKASLMVEVVEAARACSDRILHPQASIAHLVDTDDNPGQILREKLAKLDEFKDAGR